MFQPGVDRWGFVTGVSRNVVGLVVAWLVEQEAALIVSENRRMEGI